MKKDSLQGLLEPFIFNELTKTEYSIYSFDSVELLTNNRLDIAFKLFYLDIRRHHKDFAEDVYKQDIKAQTLGKFVEYGNEDNKNSFVKYLQLFDETLRSFEEKGFDEEKTLIPLSKNGSIINGSHRLASAIYHKLNVSCIFTEEKSMFANYQYFYDRNIPSEYIEMAVNKFIEYAENVYIAFLWPSGKGYKEEVESFFQNVVYKKQLKLNHTGALNLLVELYKHMDWVGAKESGFPGALQKVTECFPNTESFTVVVFQSDSIESVRKVKEKVREVYDIGFSSIHITDTKEEAKTISKLILNKNGIHFLNYANPYKFNEVHSSLCDFKEFLKKNEINKSDVVIDGSLLLTLYGLRKNYDVDCLYSDEINNVDSDLEYESHDSELVYHNTSKENLLYNPKYYFEYFGFKFVSFEQLYLMKKNRNEAKDVNDCKIMESLIDNNKIKIFLLKQKQVLYYKKIKFLRKFNFEIRFFLKKIGLHHIIKPIYRKIIKTKL